MAFCPFEEDNDRELRIPGRVKDDSRPKVREVDVEGWNPAAGSAERGRPC